LLQIKKETGIEIDQEGLKQLRKFSARVQKSLEERGIMSGREGVRKLVYD
jgi:hypothetical protein